MSELAFGAAVVNLLAMAITLALAICVNRQSRFQTPAKTALRVNSRSPLTVNPPIAVTLRVALVSRAAKRDLKSVRRSGTVPCGDWRRESLLEEVAAGSFHNPACENGPPVNARRRDSGRRAFCVPVPAPAESDHFPWVRGVGAFSCKG